VSMFVKADAVREDAFEWGVIGWRCGPGNTGSKRFIVLDATIHPGERHDFHKHPDQDEMIVVRAGRLQQYVELESEILAPGDSVYIDAGVVHASLCHGAEPAVIQIVMAPAVGTDTGYELVDMTGVEPYASLSAVGQPA
jgi:quercetin dioxygenase-like cupin family protein